MKHILIIEDSPDTRVLYQRALKDESYEVSVVSDGQEALQWLESQAAPDLILMDLRLPGLSGPELIDILKNDSRWSAIRILVVSGWENLRSFARERGISHLSKPFELGRFYEEINRCMA